MAGLTRDEVAALAAGAAGRPPAGDGGARARSPRRACCVVTGDDDLAFLSATRLAAMVRERKASPDLGDYERAVPGASGASSPIDAGCAWTRRRISSMPNGLPRLAAPVSSRNRRVVTFIESPVTKIIRRSTPGRFCATVR